MLQVHMLNMLSVTGGYDRMTRVGVKYTLSNTNLYLYI